MGPPPPPPISDIRLKRDIAAVGEADNGIGLYRYRYLWSDTTYVGVMAQEVETVKPEAVLRGVDGYMRVDYARLGLRLQTWDEWIAAQ
jgi:Chaperone of endosialidase